MKDYVNEQNILGCIFLLANKLQLFGDKVAEDITLKQWFLLNTIIQMSERVPNYSDLAKIMGTSRQNVIKMISVLQAKGMVELCPSKNDNRSIYVTLTQKGLHSLSLKEDAGEMFLDKIFEGINSDGAEQTARLIRQMLQNTAICLNGYEK